MKILLASSNPGKLREYSQLAEGTSLEIDHLPNFRQIPQFEESAPTFAENAVGKALHYGRYAKDAVLADDSGLVVPALGGAPGVHSARYAGPNGTAADCVRKLLHEMAGKHGDERRARFVCVIVVVRSGKALVVVSDLVAGVIANEPRGANGFGYDPVFYFPDAQRTFAEIPATEKNHNSHRGKAFRKAVEYLTTSIF